MIVVMCHHASTMLPVDALTAEGAVVVLITLATELAQYGSECTL
jgi:hypothetical protein